MSSAASRPDGATRFALAVAIAVAAVLALAPAAGAAGTVVVAVAGQGSATGDGINCTNAGGDCSQAYSDLVTQECTDREPPICGPPEYEPPGKLFTAGPDVNGYVFDSWTGCASAPTARACSVTVDGDKALTVRFRDAAPPSVPAVSPGSGFHRGLIPLAAAPTDNSGAISRVEFRVRDALVATDSSTPFAATFDTATVADGPAVLRATAFDAAGNSTSKDAAITIDNTGPAITVTGPAGETFGPGTTQAWSFAASDAGSGVAAVECSVVAAGAAPGFGACGSGGSHAVSNRPDGAWAFAVRARDALGNEAYAPARTFNVDATAPDTAVTSGPSDGSSSTDTSATFGFAATEAGSSFECRVYPAALTPPAFGACSSASGHTASGFSRGTYAFEVRSRDAYGNVDASPAKRTFSVTRASTVDFDPRFSFQVDYKGPKTTFTMLLIRQVPKGATVLATCAGKGCRFKRKPLSGDGKLNVLGKLKPLRLRSGAVLKIRITGPAGHVKVAAFKVRTGKSPKATFRCAAPGGKLAGCA